MRSGFTLAEVAVTLLIVGFALVLVLQGLNSAKINAAQTHNRKVARELALLQLGRVEAGYFWEDLDGEAGTLYGTFAEDGYENWRWELGFGEDHRPSEASVEDEGYWDNWEWEREQELERQREEGENDDEETAAEPYEQVFITVSYPKLGDQPNRLTIERWIPWELVYGVEPGDLEEPESGDPTGELAQ